MKCLPQSVRCATSFKDKYELVQWQPGLLSLSDKSNSLAHCRDELKVSTVFLSGLWALPLLLFLHVDLPYIRIASEIFESHSKNVMTKHYPKMKDPDELLKRERASGRGRLPSSIFGTDCQTNQLAITG